MSQLAVQFQGAMAEAADALECGKREYTKIKQARVNRGDRYAASGRGHPVINFDLHIMECHELNILQLSFRKDWRRLTALRATEADFCLLG